MAQAATLKDDLQVFHNEVSAFIHDVRTDYRGRTLNVWMEPSSGAIEVTADTILSKVTAATNTYVWARMDELEAKYDKGGPSCQCEAINAATREVMGEEMKGFNKDVDGLCLKEGGYYALPADSTLSDAAKLEIKAVSDKTETILHGYRADARNVIVYMPDSAKETQDAKDFLGDDLNKVLEGVFREAVELWEAHTEDEFFYLLASTIKQVRDQHVVEFKTMVVNAVVEWEMKAGVAESHEGVEARADETGAEAEAEMQDAGMEDEVMAEPVEDVRM